MDKNTKLRIVLAAVIGLLIVALVGLLIADAAKNDWKFSFSGSSKSLIVLAGLVLSLVRLIAGISSPRSLRIYEKAYKDEIGNAFSRSDNKKYKTKLLKALALYNENRFGDALKLLEELEDKCNTADDFCAVTLFKALCYSDSGAAESAIKEYETLLKYNAKHGTAWSNLGLLYKKQGKASEAMRCYDNAVKVNPDSAYAWNNLAHAYLTACQWQKVIEPALRSLELKANMYQADTALAVAYYALGNADESKKHFEHAVANGGNADAIMSVLDSIAKGVNPFAEPVDVSDEVKRAIGFIKRDTAVPMVEIRLPAPEDGNKTRLGGAPVDEVVPLDSEGNPMHLLAAIWCSEVRGVPDFPERGVLRFYISGNDYYGLDLDEPNLQNDFRVLYDEDEDKFDGSLRDDPNIPAHFPIMRALPVRLSPAMGSILSTDYRFEEAVDAALKKAGLENGVDDISDEEFDLIHEENSYGGHRIGGYPCFTQDDPRDVGDSLHKYDTLLLQIVSHSMPDENGKEEDLIMFGDDGGCQFFIPREKLRNRDFSDVMYNWDCY
ncbi:MAG: DUF1963 domain-containing protein [Clostridia bacterium]|nr:DUF1963 domain-containing protein [Clostridia bacterium]